MSALSFFPTETFKEPRPSQVTVINAIEQGFKDGYKNVLVEAPVGSGKSAIAITLANYFKEAHILTPRKSLQDQYYEDFKDHVVLMKGRGAYPCTYKSEDNPEYEKIVTLIRTGRIPAPGKGVLSCADGPCIGNQRVLKICTGKEDNPITQKSTYKTPCPYGVALDVAQKESVVIHNLHSFIFQAYFAERFQQRPLLVVDECHEIEATIRGFATKKTTFNKLFDKKELLEETKEFKNLAHWFEYFCQDKFTELFSKVLDVNDSSPFLEYKLWLESLVALSDGFGENFVTTIETDGFRKTTRFEFIPGNVSSLCNKLLFDFGDKRLLLSGTIYNKAVYCATVGLNPEETLFIKIPSTFPVETRPILAFNEYQVDTSFKTWDENYAKIVSNLRDILSRFHDVKGLIHAPSYKVGFALHESLKDMGRTVIHEKENFLPTLEEFFKTPGNRVLISPVCQQGVDFKGDRAIFQVLIRVPYPSTSDPFVEKKVKTDFPWFNYQALVTFGQMLGRVNRSEDDFGVSILLDSRFNKFIRQNNSVLPKWLTAAVRYK